MNPARLAVDVGGTFTDVVRLSEGGELTFGKVATTPARPTEGVIAAFDRADTPLYSVAVFTHGTILGHNGLLTRTGPRTAVMARQSFRDVCLLGRTAGRRTTGSHLECWNERTRLRCTSGYFTTAASMLRLASRALGEGQRPSGTGATQPSRSHSCMPMQRTLKRKRCGRSWQTSIHRSTCHCPLTYHASAASTSARVQQFSTPISRRSCTNPARAEQGAGGTRPGGGAMTATTARELLVNLILSGPVGHVIRSRGVVEDRRRFRPGDDRYGP